jgi:amino acid adenylation domain-containing protein
LLTAAAHPLDFEAAMTAALGVVVSKYTELDEVTIALLRLAVADNNETLLFSRPLCIRISADTSLESLQASIRSFFISAYPDPFDNFSVETIKSTKTLFVKQKCESTEIGLFFVHTEDSSSQIESPYDISFVIYCNSVPYFRVYFNDSLYDESTLKRLGGHLLMLLELVALNPTIPLSVISLVDPAEKQVLLSQFCGVTRKYPFDKTIAELFEDQARLTPYSIAIELGEESLTYEQIDLLSNQLAILLQRQTDASIQVVPVIHSRQPTFLVAILAILKCAKAFLPIDPKLPPDRIEYMLRQVSASTLLTESMFLEELGQLTAHTGIRSIITTDDNREMSQRGQSDSALFGRQDWEVPFALTSLPHRTPKDPAYVIFTSGSTGTPKGVVNRNDGAVNHIFAEVDALNLTADTRFLQTAVLSTDLCVWQFLAPVLIGGTCVISRTEEVIDPQKLFGLLSRKNISVVELVPVVLKVLTDHIATLDNSERNLPNFKWMMVTGEPVPVRLVNQWLSIYPDIPIVNAYGPTEVSDDSAQHIITQPLPETCISVPLGRPLPNLQILILDRNSKLVPVGVPGELCVSGIGVADGYWGDPERTQKAFVPNPYSCLPDDIMYKTGDRGRWLSDGTIEMLGRIDDQVKIRGYRIELGEIEAVLKHYVSIRNCVVLAREDTNKNKHLVAYIVSRDPVSTVKIREYLASKLPDYMIPTAYVFLDELPMTANGVKVNRRALPVPDYERLESNTDFVPPNTPLEKTLAAIWSRLLGYTKIGIHDNFFELGGNSMQIVELSVQAESQGIDLPITAVFEYPTIAELAKISATAGRSDHPRELLNPSQISSIPQAIFDRLANEYKDLESVFPLSSTQRGIYLSMMTGTKGLGTYNEQVRGILKDLNFDDSCFHRAWSLVANHHPVLRTIFLRRGLKQPLQAVLSKAVITFRYQDVRNQIPQCDPADLEALATDETKYRFKLDKLPMMRIIVSRIAEHKYHFIWTYPHIILDGWSESIILAQILQVYSTLKTGAQPTLPKAIPYQNYLHWSANHDQEEARKFWTNMLTGLTEPTPLPTYQGRLDDHIPASYAKRDILLSENLSSKLNQTSRRHKLTVNTILQGAWALLLAQLTERNDILFGVAVSGRHIPLKGVESIVGVLVNSIPFRISVTTNDQVIAWFTRIQKIQFQSRKYEYASFEKIKQWSNLLPEKGALYSTYFIFANYPSSINSIERESEIETIDLDYLTLPHFPLTIFIRPGQQLLIRMIYDERYLDDPNVGYLLNVYISILTNLMETPFSTLNEIRDCTEMAYSNLVKPIGGARC